MAVDPPRPQRAPSSRRPRVRRTSACSPACLCALASLCLLLPACAKAPTFSVTDVRMTAQSHEGYVLTFTLLGENPNKNPLPLREVNYSLTLDNDRVFQGSRSAQATLPAKGSQAITLPVSIPNAAAGLTAPGAAEPPPAGSTATYRIAGSIEYQLPGSIAELLFDSDIRRPKAGFTESGTFEFTEVAE